MLLASAAWRQLPHVAQTSRAFSVGATEEAAKPIEVTIEKVPKPDVQQVCLNCAAMLVKSLSLATSFCTVARVALAYAYFSCCHRQQNCSAQTV